VIWLLLTLGVVAWFACIGLAHLVPVEDPRIAMLKRCHEQHEQWMAGDDRGLYGRYPPAQI
jgi:hypothetical protein